MIASSVPARRSRPIAKPDRTLHKLVIVVALVTFLTSESVWAQFLNILGADNSHFSEAVSSPLYKDREMSQLIKMTEDSGPTRSLSADEAIERNAEIPFADASITAAKPFRSLRLSDGTGLTALRCMTQAVYFEAGFEPLQGRQAVAQVILNRMRHSAFPNSVCGVIYQGVNRPVCQFSFTCDGSLKRHPDPGAWVQAEEVARASLDGYVETSVGHSTHYHANYVSPYWAPKLVKIARIGAHIFYRWPGKWGRPNAFSEQYAGNEMIPTILPRAMRVNRNADTAETDQMTAAGRLLPGALPEARPNSGAVAENRADADVGGRLDVSKGWTANIPEPDDTYHSSRMIVRQQAGEFYVANKEDKQ